MELLAAIRQRRAIRDYTRDPVAASVLRQLVLAASWAPSAMNEQPWHFTILTEPALMDEISARSKLWMLDHVAEMIRPGHFRDLMNDPQFHIFYHAPALIVISAPKAGQWAAEDCALAAQNLMLAALEFSLGSCWIGFAEGWLNSDEGRNLLGLSDHNRVVAPIIVGHPRAVLPPVARKSPLMTWVGKLPVPFPDEGMDPQNAHNALSHP